MLWVPDAVTVTTTQQRGKNPKVSSPVEVLRASDGHQAVRVGQLGEAADLVVFLKGSSHSHDREGGFTCDPETPKNKQTK